jgi:hypothetical protein
VPFKLAPASSRRIEIAGVNVPSELQLNGQTFVLEDGKSEQRSVDQPEFLIDFLENMGFSGFTKQSILNSLIGDIKNKVKKLYQKRSTLGKN